MLGATVADSKHTNETDATGYEHVQTEALGRHHDMSTMCTEATLVDCSLCCYPAEAQRKTIRCHCYGRMRAARWRPGILN